MKNSTHSPYEAYRKVRDTITNEKNEEKHIDAINQLIRNYANKYPEEAILLGTLMRYKCDLEETFPNEK